MNPVPLHGLNNLRKLQYNIDANQLSQIYQQLQTVSSSLISEINFTYHHGDNGDNNYGSWGNIDTLMAERFSALSIVTIEWRVGFGRTVTWEHCVSQSIAALPKLHQKEILRSLLPPQDEIGRAHV